MWVQPWIDKVSFLEVSFWKDIAIGFPSTFTGRKGSRCIFENLFLRHACLTPAYRLGLYVFQNNFKACVVFFFQVAIFFLEMAGPLAMKPEFFHLPSTGCQISLSCQQKDLELIFSSLIGWGPVLASAFPLITKCSGQTFWSENSYIPVHLK